MAVNDLYMLLDKQDFNGQEFINCYHYLNVDSDGSAEDLADAFAQDVLPSILPVQRPSLVHQLIEVINLDDPSDFHTLAVVGGAGTYPTGSGQQSFVSLAYKWLRTTRAIRNGRKAIGGIGEDITTVNGVNPADQAIVDAVAAAMGLTIDAPLGAAQFAPYLRGLPNLNRPEEIRTPIAGVVFSHIGTQNSRKAY